MAIALTLSQIIALSGGNARRMKHLATEGVFVANDEPRASRVARTYSMSEAALACIVSQLDRFNIPAGTLQGIAESLRHIYRVPVDHSFKNKDEAHRFWARELLLTINKDSSLSAAEKEKQALSIGLENYPTGKPAGLSAEESHRIRNWVALELAREGKPTQLSIAVKEDGSWTYWVDAQPRDDDNQTIFIVINLHRVLAALR